MTFANPLVINYAAGTKSLPKINNDNYGSEYYLRESTQEFRVKIRHSKEQARSGTPQVERHNVEFTRVVFATESSPEITQQVYAVFRVQRGDSVTDAAELGAAMSDLMVEAKWTDLGNWLN